jgi:hypothetical protein
VVGLGLAVTGFYMPLQSGAPLVPSLNDTVKLPIGLAFGSS